MPLFKKRKKEMPYNNLAQSYGSPGPMPIESLSMLSLPEHGCPHCDGDVQEIVREESTPNGGTWRGGFLSPHYDTKHMYTGTYQCVGTCKKKFTSIDQLKKTELREPWKGLKEIFEKARESTGKL